MQMGVEPDMQEPGRQGKHTQESYSRQGRYARQTGKAARQVGTAGKERRWVDKIGRTG